jgi:hypothetical protein
VGEVVTKPSKKLFGGEPGTTWTNDTGRVRYQLICNWANTCGVCAQYDHQIGPWWGIPLHRGCRCRQIAIKPGGVSKPFVDFMKIVDDLPPSQRAVVVGASNYKLIKAGVVKWSDVVSPSRVRDLREVVSIHKISIETMEGAGVQSYIAQKAHQAVHSPAHEAAEAQRHELASKLKGAGLAQQTIADALGKAMAQRIVVASKPTFHNPGGTPQKPPTPHGGSLAELLSGLKRSPKEPVTPVVPKRPEAPAPNQAPSAAASKVGWKPVMSAAEAEEFTRGSEVPETLYHVTQAGAEIKTEGFRLDVAEANGRVWGDGVYLAANEDTKNFYAVRSRGAQTLNVKVNVKKVLHFDATGRTGGESMVNDLIDDALHKRAEFTKIKKGMEAHNTAILAEFMATRRADPKAFRGAAGNEWLEKRGYVADDIKIERAALTELLKREGYDAIKITERGTVSGSVGGTQLIVLDPKKVVVVGE